MFSVGRQQGRAKGFTSSKTFPATAVPAILVRGDSRDFGVALG